MSTTDMSPNLLLLQLAPSQFMVISSLMLLRPKTLELSLVLSLLSAKRSYSCTFRLYPAKDLQWPILFLKYPLPLFLLLTLLQSHWPFCYCSNNRPVLRPLAGPHFWDDLCPYFHGISYITFIFAEMSPCQVGYTLALFNI